MSTTIQNKRNTAANWASGNPVLLEGEIGFETDTNLIKIGDGVTTYNNLPYLSGSGGSGGINYIQNGSAAVNANGWVTYADAAQALPEDGSGGTPTITWTRSTDTPLRGKADFNLIKAASNSIGQGVRYDFTIDSADLAKVLTVSFSYEVVSGTYSDGDLTVYLIEDPTSANPKVIQPAGYKVQAAVIGQRMRQVATFQTSSTVKSYRLVLHVASASTSAYTLAFTDVTVGPQAIQYGAAITTPTQYTPTIVGFGTVTGVGVFSYRRGATLYVYGKFTAGTVTGTAGTISLGLAGGAVVASSQYSGSSYTMVGRWVRNNSTGSTNKSGALLALSSSGNLSFGIDSYVSASDPLAPVNGSSVCLTGETISFWAEVYVEGWSSTVQMSSDTDTRVVVAAAENTASAAYSTSVPMDYSSVKFDSHGAITTGSGWKFTAPVSGYYQVFVTGTASTSTGGSAYIYKNGTAAVVLFNYPSVATYKVAGSAIVQLNAGDYIDIRPGSAVTTVPGYVSIARLSGPSSIASSETVAARYTSSSGQSLGVSGTIALINFETKDFDTHGAVTTGVAWKFTAPVSGKYLVTAAISPSISGAATKASRLYKNGNFYCSFDGKTADSFLSAGSTMVSLNAGEYIDFRHIWSGTGSAFLATQGAENHISIARIGN